MRYRSREGARCTGCRLLKPICMCELIPNLSVRSHVIAVVHKIEDSKPTNTAQLIARALTGAECRLHGVRDEQFDDSDFDDTTHRPLMLFPGDDARILNREFIAEDSRPIRLLVPDGTWRQARRIYRRITEKHRVECVALEPGLVSTYRLRRNEREGELCTYEAIKEAICVIEGEHLREPLESLFRIFVERTLWARGTLNASEVTGGVGDAKRHS